MKCYTGPQIWMYSVVRPKQWAVDMRFGTRNVGYTEVWVTEEGFERVGEVQVGSGGANVVSWDKGGTG